MGSDVGYGVGSGVGAGVGAAVGAGVSEAAALLPPQAQRLSTITATSSSVSPLRIVFFIISLYPSCYMFTHGKIYYKKRNKSSPIA